MSEPVKNDDRVDKGFCFRYSKLSNRRKFIRNLWMTPAPFWLVIMEREAIEHFFDIPQWVTALVFIGGFFALLFYTYNDWKNEEKSKVDK
ncbi:MAG: hypothetical protein DRQ51_08675 [Gammaproteobacteria bacterium]|nr:MAG: hypothetical protein DRQ51_08675 [Gammaproteobacteria bacterium]